MDPSVKLPQTVANSDEFRLLNENQQLSLMRRLDNAKELAASLATEARLEISEDFADFVEDLELDAALLQELDAAGGGGLSRWQIHHSWTFETSPPEMAKTLSAETMALVDVREPGLAASLEEYRVWFRDFGRRLADLIEEFSAADSFAAAMALHVVLDMMLARLLVSCYKLRISQAMPR